MEVGMGSNCWSWGVHSFPRDSPCSRRAVLVTELAALQLAPQTKEGRLSVPCLCSVCGGSTRKVKKSAGARAVTKRGRAKGGSNPKTTAPALNLASGLLQREGLPVHTA